MIKYYSGRSASLQEILSIEKKNYYELDFDTQIYKDKVLIIIVSYTCLPAIKLCIESILETLDNSLEAYALILDNDSKTEIQNYLKTIKHKKLNKIFIGQNLGKAVAVNNFGQRFINETNLPRTIISIDPDITFSSNDFNKMVQASQNIKKIGMLGMRYHNNSCNPEINLFFPAKKIRGTDKNNYKLKCPFLSTVAGPIFAITGNIFQNVLKYRLFPKKFLATYGGDDSATYSALQWKYINGYLEGTQVTHLRTRSNISDELKKYMD